MTQIESFKFHLKKRLGRNIPVFNRVEDTDGIPRFLLFEYLGEGQKLATNISRSARFRVTYGNALSEGDFQEEQEQFLCFMDNSTTLKERTGEHVVAQHWARTDSWEIEVSE